MMKFIQNSEPVVFMHHCDLTEKGQKMTEQEQRNLLVNNLMDIYARCAMKASLCQKPKLSFIDKLTGRKNLDFYPDIQIRDFHGGSESAYYIILPKGTPIDTIDTTQLPKQMQDAYIKVIFGSVFCLDTQTPDQYIKGAHYVAQYESKAILPKQENQPLEQILSDKELAEVYVNAWETFDTSKLEKILDKDFHYLSDFVFDDMASRDEYLTYLKEKFATMKRVNNVLKVQLGRNGENGEWMALVKTMLNNGKTSVAGFFIKSQAGRIKSINLYELDLPNF